MVNWELGTGEEARGAGGVPGGADHAARGAAEVARGMDVVVAAMWRGARGGGGGN
jgi:hypothetical protein